MAIIIVINATLNPTQQHHYNVMQAGKAGDGGTVRMKRAMLVQAGLALAPDAFGLVLDGEMDSSSQFACRLL